MKSSSSQSRRKSANYTSDGTVPAVPALKQQPLSMEPAVTDHTQSVSIVRDCRRCGWCCTVDLVPIKPELIDRDSLYLIECRGGQLVNIQGQPGLYIQYPLRCKYLQSNMLCALWNTPIRPAPCENSPCLQGRITPAVLDWM